MRLSRQFSLLALLAALQIGAAGLCAKADCKMMMAVSSCCQCEHQSDTLSLSAPCCQSSAENAVKILPTLAKSVPAPEPVLMVTALVQHPTSLKNLFLSRPLFESRGPPSVLTQSPVLRI